MTPQEQISENAVRAIEMCGPISGLGARFGYNRESVEWLDGHIERLRASGGLSPEQIENLTEIFACFLGECMRVANGGNWRKRDGMWGVFFEDSSGAIPFNKVHKQFVDGAEGGESILLFFDFIPELLSGRLDEKPTPVPQKFMSRVRAILKRVAGW